MLVVLTSHPIQYQVSIWRRMAAEESIDFEVWFLTPHAVEDSYDREFGETFSWDEDLLSGYPHRFLNVGDGWRLDRFFGITMQESWGELFLGSQVTHLWIEGWRFFENWKAIREASRLGIEVALRGETNDLRPRYGLKAKVRKILLKYYFSKVDRFLCIGSANQRFYESFGISNTMMLSAPYCVDNDWFFQRADLESDRRDELRQQWGIESAAFCLLFCGKFIEKKRPTDLLLAAKALCERISEAKIHILYVGSGELKQAISEQANVIYDENRRIERSGNSEQWPRISFTGFLNQNRIVEAYVAADLLVLPSDYGETWGLVINEAMASGLPAIGSARVGASEDLLSAYRAESVFNFGDIDAIASSIEAMMERPETSSDVRIRIENHDPDVTVRSVKIWLDRGEAPNSSV